MAVSPLTLALAAYKAFQAHKRWRQFRKFRKAIKEGEMNEQFASVVRTLFKSVGGGLVTAGYVNASELEVLAGAVAVVVGLAWSYYVKRKA